MYSNKIRCGSQALMAILSIVFAVSLSGCPKKPAQVNRDAVVKIGYLPIYVDLPVFVAKEKGMFKKRGIDAQLIRFSSSPEIGTALLTGDIQFGASIAYSVALGNESRDPGKLKIFIVDSETKDNYLSSIVVLPKSGIKTVEDLKGKKLASFPGPTAVTFCKMVLEKHGINPEKDITIVELEIGSHLSALEAGTVDALFTYEPTGTQAVLEKGAVKILPGAVESEIISPWQAGVWVVASGYYKTDPKTADKAIQALYEAIEFIRTNPAEAKKALSKYTSIKPAVAAATPNIPFAKLGEVDMEALQKQTDILYDRKIVSKKIVAADMILPGQGL